MLQIQDPGFSRSSGESWVFAWAVVQPPLLALGLGLLLTGCTHPGVYRPWVQAPRPEAKGMAVHFNQRRGHSYISPLSGQRREGENLEQVLIEAIGSARHEILVAVQELTLPAVAEALIAKHRAGVKVQVVLEHQYREPWSLLHPAGLEPHAKQRLRRLKRLGWADAVLLMDRAGVPLIDDTADGSKGSGLMHHKFMVIDRERVITGSANITSSGIHGDGAAPRTRGNVNHLLAIKSPQLARLFADEFAQLWGDGPKGERNSRFGLKKQQRGAQRLTLHSSQITVLFAPQRPGHKGDGLALIRAELQKAKRSIDLALFVFSAQELADVLKAKQAEGVAIRVLVDPGFGYRSYSELLDLLGKQLPDHRCRIEKGNKPWSTPLSQAGIPRLPRGDKLHHKFAVIDNKTVITGSFNWSPSAAHRNDETLLVIRSKPLAAQFTREMERLWAGAELGITPHLHRKLERQKIRCGDGVERN